MSRSLGKATAAAVSILVCVAGFTGCPCIGSLHPLYEGDDLITDASVEGQWRFIEADGELPDAEGQDIFTVCNKNNPPETIFSFDIPPNLPASLYTPKDLPTYRLEAYKPQKNEKPVEKEAERAEDGQGPEAREADDGDEEDPAFLFRLVELKGKRFVDIIGEPNTGFVAPGHWFARLREVETGLEVDLLNFDWIVDYIEEKPRALKYEVLPIDRGRDAWLLLTTKPKALQRFVLKHYDTPEAWERLGRFERVADMAPEKTDEK